MIWARARLLEGERSEFAGLKLILLHGPDGGLVQRSAAAVLDRLQACDPNSFGAEDVSGTSVPDVLALLQTPPLGGQRAFLRARDISEKFFAVAEAVLAAPISGILVAEGGELPSRSKLRGIVERHREGVAVLCRPMNDQQRRKYLQEQMLQVGATCDSDTWAEILRHADAAQGNFAEVVDRLLSYTGTAGVIDRTAVSAVCDADSGGRLDQGIAAALLGNVREADSIVDGLLADGLTGIAIIRAALLQITRVRSRDPLHDQPDVAPRNTLIRAGSRSAFGDAVGRERQSGLAWTSDALDLACVAFVIAERLCKSNGVPENAVARSSMAWLARQSGGRRSSEG